HTTLGSLAALLAGARLLVCNDTGVSHLAAALKVPSVVLSTGNNPERWAPANVRRHRVLCDDKGVDPAEVICQAADLLAGEEQLSKEREQACSLCASRRGMSTDTIFITFPRPAPSSTCRSPRAGLAVSAAAVRPSRSGPMSTTCRPSSSATSTSTVCS